MDPAIFGPLKEVWPVALKATIGYITLVLFLRAAGKRALTRLNAFDMVVTVALGTTLASTIISSSVTLTEGLSALLMLLLLQHIVEQLSVRSDRFARMVKSDPTLLYYQGRFLRDRMRRERISEREIHQGVRSAGLASLDQVGAVILETNGKLSAIPRGEERGSDVLGEEITMPESRAAAVGRKGAGDSP